MRPRPSRPIDLSPVERLEPRRLLSTTYYVSPAGKDANPGTSAARPFATLAAVNQLHLRAGDQVLLAAGKTFAGPLTLSADDAGTAADPITVSSYGTGRATLDGGTGDGIQVFDTAGVDVTDLNVVGDGLPARVGTGIRLVNDQAGDTKLAHVYISSVDVSGFGVAGIAVVGTVDGAGGGSGFRDVRITDALVHGNGHDGIWTYAGDPTLNPAPYGLAHADIYVGDVWSYDNAGFGGRGDSGNGIVLGNVSGGTVEHCVAHDNGADNDSTGGGPVGIWTYNSDHVVLQYDESYDNSAQNKDGGGFDLDGGSTNCTVQYDYSHGNGGAGVLLCQFLGATAWSGNVVRYNVSQDDGRRNGYAGIDLWTPDDSVTLADSQVYGNTVYMSDAADDAPIGLRVDASTDDVGIYNNVFQVAADLSPVVVEEAGTGLTLAGNDYWTGSATALNLVWLGDDIETLAGWRTVAGQELLAGADTGLAAAPALTDPGNGPTVDDADDLPSALSAYLPTAASPLIDAGVDLATLGLDPGGVDFFGSALPQGANLDVGAGEYVAPATTADPSGNTTPTPTATPAPTPTITAVTLTASATGPVATGTAVTFAAVVSPAGATGTVTFTTADGTLLGAAAVATDGSASLTITALPVGVDSVTAAYGGDATFAADASPAVAATVNPLALSPAVVTTTVPTSVVAGARVRGRVTLTVTNAAATTVTGPGKVELFAAPAGVLDGSAVAVAGVTRRVSLRPGRSATLTVPVTALPAGMAAGSYSWVARVTDAAGRASVSPAGPSWTVSAATVSLSTTVRRDRLATTAAAGRGAGSVTVAVTNAGNAASTAPLSATLYLSADGQLGDAVVVSTATRRTTVRPAGAAVSLTLNVGRLPTTVPAGSYTVLIVVTDAAGDTTLSTLPAALVISKS